MARTQTSRPRRAARTAALLVAASLLLVGLPAAASPDSDAPSIDADVAQLLGSGDGQALLEDILDENGRLRVIVELDVAPPPGWLKASLARSHQRSAIASEASSVAADTERLDAVVGRSFETLPFLAVAVAPTDLDELLGTPGVRAVEADASVVPLLDLSVPAIDAGPEAPPFLDTGLTGAGQTVGVIDTGIDRHHPFFDMIDIKEACFTDAGCSDGEDHDLDQSNGVDTAAPAGDHGTHVAGIAVGSQDEGGDPERGVAPAANLIAVQIFKTDADGKRSGGRFSDLAAGLTWIAEQQGAEANIAAVNISLGTTATYADGCTVSVMSAAVDAALDAGIATIAAAGNESDPGQMSAPACMSNVLAVGATTLDGNIAAYSNLSEATDVVAPGSGIRSATLNNAYSTKSGTSMAAPHVAGAAALLREAAPHATPSHLRAALAASSTMVEDTRGDGITVPMLNVPDALLDVPGPPGAPAAPSSVVATDNEVEETLTISWDASSGTPHRYDVLSSPEGLGCTSSADSPDAPALFCDVSGLTRGVNYTFTVRATNDAGSSSASVPSAPASPAVTAGSPGPPLNVSAVAGNGEATVSWSPPDVTGDTDIKSYVATSTDSDDSCAAAADEFSCIIDGLENGQAYTFSVRATNEQGPGPNSTASNAVTPRTEPGPPTGVTAQRDAGSVHVSWEPPASDGGSDMTGYKVDGAPSGTCTTGGEETACTVLELTNGQIYTFTVTAMNSAGSGPASDPTPEVVPAAVPEPPTNVAAIAADPGEAEVSWTAPEDDGGSPILSYRATSDPGGRTCDVHAPGLSCIVTGLTQGSEYTFTVTAINDRGPSDPSEVTGSVRIATDSNGNDGGGDLGGGGGGALPPPEPEEEDDDGAGDDEPAPVTNPDGSLPSQPPGTSTLLLDGEPVEATVTTSGSSVTVSGEGFSLTLAALTSDRAALSSTDGTSLQLSAGGQLGVAFDGLQRGSSLDGWLFSDPVLLGTAPATSAGDGDATWPVPDDTATGTHTVQINGTLADERSVTFNLGIDVEAAVSFSDVDPDATHGEAILRLARLGIVAGFGDGTFGPALPVNRGQMASFLQRALELEPGASGAFPDTAGTTHDLAISAIADAEIATGFEDGTYRPGEPVTRGQMATFLANAVELIDVPDGPFIDIDGNVHAGRINAVAAAEIAEGFDDSTYRPALDITRAQMASLISRMLDHLAAVS